MDTTTSLKEQLLRKEAAAFRQIPGMDKLRHSNDPKWTAAYPDAAFALMLSQNLHMGDREQNEIHQRTYLSILNGMSIPDARFRYEHDTDAYLRRHMWD